MKKTLIFIVAIIVVIIGVVLYVFNRSISKTKIEEGEYKAIVSEYGMQTVDATSDFKNEDLVKFVLKSSKNNEFDIIYVKTDGNENAETLFEILKENIEEKYGMSSGTYGSVKGPNEQHYTLNNDYYYAYISQVKDTIIYTIVKTDYKNEVKKIIDNLGY